METQAQIHPDTMQMNRTAFDALSQLEKAERMKAGWTVVDSFTADPDADERSASDAMGEVIRNSNAVPNIDPDTLVAPMNRASLVHARDEQVGSLRQLREIEARLDGELGKLSEFRDDIRRQREEPIRRKALDESSAILSEMEQRNRNFDAQAVAWDDQSARSFAHFEDAQQETLWSGRIARATPRTLWEYAREAKVTKNVPLAFMVEQEAMGRGIDLGAKVTIVQLCRMASGEKSGSIERAAIREARNLMNGARAVAKKVTDRARRDR